MSLSLSFVMFMRFLLLLSPLSLVSAASFPSFLPLCHDDESFALLQFKESLIINQSTSAYSKNSSWMAQSSDCCTWDGIQCDENTGHVIGLDLSNSSLYGSINSSSSLFQLVHLQKLRPCLVHPLKHIFSVFKQHYTYFHLLFHLHVFLYMFLNNKTHVFKCMYQTPP